MQKKTFKFDLHVHTKNSPCSHLSTDDIIEHAAANGLDGVCITDHHSLETLRIIREGIQYNGLCVIIGMEYTTSDGDFLLFGSLEELPGSLSAVNLLERVKHQGGVAISAHPFRENRPTSEYIVRNNLCNIVEGINGRNSEFENLQINRWRKKYRINEVGGSDAHEIEEIGRVVTQFNTPVTSLEDLVKALKSGAYHPEWNHSDNTGYSIISNTGRR